MNDIFTTNISNYTFWVRRNFQNHPLSPVNQVDLEVINIWQDFVSNQSRYIFSALFIDILLKHDTYLLLLQQWLIQNQFKFKKRTKIFPVPYFNLDHDEERVTEWKSSLFPFAQIWRITKRGENDLHVQKGKHPSLNLSRQILDPWQRTDQSSSWDFV